MACLAWLVNTVPERKTVLKNADISTLAHQVSVDTAVLLRPLQQLRVDSEMA